MSVETEIESIAYFSDPSEADVGADLADEALDLADEALDLKLRPAEFVAIP